jgi:excisionase family DNA binding protein
VSTEKQVFSVAEAGKILGLSRNTAYKAAKAGDIPTIKIGSKMLVPMESMRRILSGEAPAGKVDA